MTRNLLIRILCYAISAAALLSAAGYLARGDDKGLGVFLVLLAAIVSRVLVLNIAIPMEHQSATRTSAGMADGPADAAASGDSAGPADSGSSAGSAESADQSAR